MGTTRGARETILITAVLRIFSDPSSRLLGRGGGAGPAVPKPPEEGLVCPVPIVVPPWEVYAEDGGGGISGGTTPSKSPLASVCLRPNLGGVDDHHPFTFIRHVSPDDGILVPISGGICSAVEDRRDGVPDDDGDIPQPPPTDRPAADGSSLSDGGGEGNATTTTTMTPTPRPSPSSSWIRRFLWGGSYGGENGSEEGPVSVPVSLRAETPEAAAAAMSSAARATFVPPPLLPREDPEPSPLASVCLVTNTFLGRADGDALADFGRTILVPGGERGSWGFCSAVEDRRDGVPDDDSVAWTPMITNGTFADSAVGVSSRLDGGGSGNETDTETMARTPPPSSWLRRFLWGDGGDSANGTAHRPQPLGARGTSASLTTVTAVETPEFEEGEEKYRSIGCATAEPSELDVVGDDNDDNGDRGSTSPEGDGERRSGGDKIEGRETAVWPVPTAATVGKRSDLEEEEDKEEAGRRGSEAAEKEGGTAATVTTTTTTRRRRKGAIYKEDLWGTTAVASSFLGGEEGTANPAEENEIAVAIERTTAAKLKDAEEGILVTEEEEVPIPRSTDTIRGSKGVAVGGARADRVASSTLWTEEAGGGDGERTADSGAEANASRGENSPKISDDAVAGLRSSLSSSSSFSPSRNLAATAAVRVNSHAVVFVHVSVRGGGTISNDVTASPIPGRWAVTLEELSIPASVSSSGSGNGTSPTSSSWELSRARPIARGEVRLRPPPRGASLPPTAAPGGAAVEVGTTTSTVAFVIPLGDGVLTPPKPSPPPSPAAGAGASERTLLASLVEEISPPSGTAGEKWERIASRRLVTVGGAWEGSSSRGLVVSVYLDGTPTPPLTTVTVVQPGQGSAREVDDVAPLLAETTGLNYTTKQRGRGRGLIRKTASPTNEELSSRPHPDRRGSGGEDSPSAELSEMPLSSLLSWTLFGILVMVILLAIGDVSSAASRSSHPLDQDRSDRDCEEDRREVRCGRGGVLLSPFSRGYHWGDDGDEVRLRSAGRHSPLFPCVNADEERLRLWKLKCRDGAEENASGKGGVIVESEDDLDVAGGVDRGSFSGEINDSRSNSMPPPPPVRRWVEGKLFHPEFLVPAGPGREEPFPSSPPPAETAGIIRPIGTVWPSADSNPPIGNTAARLAPACVDPPEVACPPPTTPRTDGGVTAVQGGCGGCTPDGAETGKEKDEAIMEKVEMDKVEEPPRPESGVPMTGIPPLVRRSLDGRYAVRSELSPPSALPSSPYPEAAVELSARLAAPFGGGTVAGSGSKVVGDRSGVVAGGNDRAGAVANGPEETERVLLDVAVRSRTEGSSSAGSSKEGRAAGEASGTVSRDPAQNRGRAGEGAAVCGGSVAAASGGTAEALRVSFIPVSGDGRNDQDGRSGCRAPPSVDVARDMTPLTDEGKAGLDDVSVGQQIDGAGRLAEWHKRSSPDATGMEEHPSMHPTASETSLCLPIDAGARCEPTVEVHPKRAEGLSSDALEPPQPKNGGESEVSSSFQPYSSSVFERRDEKESGGGEGFGNNLSQTHPPQISPSPHNDDEGSKEGDGKLDRLISLSADKSRSPGESGDEGRTDEGATFNVGMLPLTTSLYSSSQGGGVAQCLLCPTSPTTTVAADCGATSFGDGVRRRALILEKSGGRSSRRKLTLFPEPRKRGRSERVSRSSHKRRRREVAGGSDYVAAAAGDGHSSSRDRESRYRHTKQSSGDNYLQITDLQKKRKSSGESIPAKASFEMSPSTDLISLSKNMASPVWKWDDAQVQDDLAISKEQEGLEINHRLAKKKECRAIGYRTSTNNSNAEDAANNSLKKDSSKKTEGGATCIYLNRPEIKTGVSSFKSRIVEVSDGKLGKMSPPSLRKRKRNLTKKTKLKDIPKAIAVRTRASTSRTKLNISGSSPQPGDSLAKKRRRRMADDKRSGRKR